MTKKLIKKLKEKRQSKKLTKSHKPKKNIFLKIFISLFGSLLLLAFISIVYFLVLISVEYKSFPFITKTIEKKINQSISAGVTDGNSISIEQSSIKFNKLHIIEVVIDGIKLHIAGSEEFAKDIVLPKIDAEFSIFDLAILNTIPSKIKIINPEIEIDSSNNKPTIAVNGLSNQDILLQKDHFGNLSQLFLSLKDGRVEIKNFSIINAKINFKNKQQQHAITLKESQIKTFFADGYLHFNSHNNISFDRSFPDLSLNTDCKFKIDDGLKCAMQFKNFSPSSILFIDKKLSPLKDIIGNFDGDVDFAVRSDHSLSEASFVIKSSAGSFYYQQFFDDKIHFTNLEAAGKLDNVSKIIALDHLNCNFGDTKFAMSLNASNFLDKNLQKMSMQFKVNNMQVSKLDLLWPTFLNHHNVRKWVIANIKDGMVKDGYATMDFAYKNGVDTLVKLDSELAFSGLSLQYNKNFPPLSSLDGIASFTDKQMKIDIVSGKVLDSKINIANVTIPDFNAKLTMLEISGKTSGAAEDLFKHIDYKSKFAENIDDYFNGQSQTYLNIKLPIKDHISLADAYIKVESGIQNFNNDYITNDSSLAVSTVKEFGSNYFTIEADLTNANIDLKQFAIAKQKGVESKIKTILSFGDNYLHLKNFDWQQKLSGLKGDLSLQIEPLEVVEINLKNYNFANSNFDLNYKITSDSRFVKLRGKQLDLRSLLGGDAGFKSSSHYQRNLINIDIGKVNLANDQEFKDVSININCDGSVCRDGFVKGKLNATQAIDIAISKPSDKSSSEINGRVGDISVLAKAFNLSNQIVGGNAKIKAKFDDEGNLKTELRIDSGFAILKNDVVEKIYNNKAFADLKEKALSSDQTKFENLKLEFVLKNNVIHINTLIANSYLMGFTAKGRVDLSKDAIAVKGLIVPGYALNKLFGIGQIPVLGRIIVGEEGGGIFAVRYDYTKNSDEKKGDFSINPASAVIPGGIRNVFDLF